MQVEMFFGRVKGMWRAVAMEGCNQLRRIPIGRQYRVAVLMANCDLCIKQQETRFGLRPPQLEDYLSDQFYSACSFGRC